jgi:hypothetical protein
MAPLLTRAWSGRDRTVAIKDRRPGRPHRSALIVDLADVEAVAEDATLPFCGLLANGNTIERQTQRRDTPKITLGAFLATLMNETGNLELI